MTTQASDANTLSAPLSAPAGAPADGAAQAAESLSAMLPHDLSPWGMFMGADIVVKAVMIGLALASVATWTVWLVKAIELRNARKRANDLLDKLGESRSLTEAVRKVEIAKGDEYKLLRAAMAEVRHPSATPHISEGLKERVGSRLDRLQLGLARKMTAGTGILASIGSIAPFVGLFGTVWGIMNSFVGIAKSQTTNLAVVAPGIAEALLATAIGLVAAIPAVVIYNILARSIGGYKLLLGDAAAEIERMISRDLDRHALPQAEAAE